MTDGRVKLSTAGDTTSYTLVDHLRATDPAAWVRFVDLYGPLVYDWCRRWGLQPADAADIGQEVFTAVARAIKKFRADRPGDSFRGWLFTITRNEVRTWVKKTPPAPPGGSKPRFDLNAVPAPPADESSVVTERRYLTRRATDRVRAAVCPETWAAFWRTVVDGESPDDVAAALGTTRNAVYLAKARVRKRLKQELAAVSALTTTLPAGPGRDGR